jgi:hypothetical protein
MEKMMKTAKNFASMAKGAYWTCVVCAVLIAAGAVVFAAIPEAFFEEVTTSLIFGPVQAELYQAVSMDTGASRLRLVGGLLLTEALVLGGCYIAWIVGQIMAPMSEGKPFACSVSRNLKKLAIAVLIFGGVYEIGMAVVALASYSYFDLSQIFNPEMVADISVQFQVDLWFLVVFGIGMLASYVFRYGEELQQLSDETV